MSRYHSYINSALNIIEAYKGEKPFAVFIKQLFAANKKYGSRDRKQIASLCYNFFRMGFAGSDLLPDQKMLLATFLCETEPSPVLEKLQPEWNNLITVPLLEKLAIVRTQFSLLDIFPFEDELSKEIETAPFIESLLKQPDLFMRIRPKAKTNVLKKLEKFNLPFQLIDNDCVRFPTSANLEEFFELDKEVVIQDYNSQKVLSCLKNICLPFRDTTGNRNTNFSVWDCCAASGGKSILFSDVVSQKFDLTVSDIRPGIISNLHQRFKKAGIKEYKYFIADISNSDVKELATDVDIIICDAPCSGSGTWSRTPEQLCFFKRHTIQDYSILQKQIVSNVLPYLRRGGLFIYITCSVFEDENENIAEFIASDCNAKLLQQQFLAGYEKKADSMFVAVFEKQ